MIEAIEDPFSTDDQKDCQETANAASYGAGIGLAEAPEDVPSCQTFGHPHAEEPESNTENIKKPYSHSILDFHNAVVGKQLGQDPLIPHQPSPHKEPAEPLQHSKGMGGGRRKHVWLSRCACIKAQFHRENLPNVIAFVPATP
jgi:hypothetical protein